MSEVSTYRSEVRVRRPDQVPLLLEALGQAAKAVGASVAAADKAASALAGPVSALNQGIDRLSSAFNRTLAKIVCGSASQPKQATVGAVGVRIGADGRVHLDHDPTGASAEMARKLQHELECRYRAIAVAKFFREKGYPFQVIPGNGRITILSSVPNTERKVAAVIDEQGNIALDHHKFTANSCVPQRQEMLRALAQLGIEAEATSRRPKGDEGDHRATIGPQVNV